MQLPVAVVDAFTEGPFSGNPAAVVVLPDDVGWPPDALCLAIAAQHNLSETAFLHRTASDDDRTPAYRLRWWTPAVEVALCGHATLASAALLLEDHHPDADEIAFGTASGRLVARRAAADAVTLDFPATDLSPEAPGPGLLEALGLTAGEGFRGSEDVVVVVPDEATVRSLSPDRAALERLDERGVVVTAPGDAGTGVDVVSRWFGARSGVAEDPVTGSAHSQIARYWCERLGRTSFSARQLSARGGALEVLLDGDRAFLTGRYRRYLDGTITVLPS